MSDFIFLINLVKLWKRDYFRNQSSIVLWTIRDTPKLMSGMHYGKFVIYT